MNNLVAIVKSLVGQVFAVSLDGLKRQIFEGERLLLGEQVLTGLGGAVTLQLANGELVNVGQSSNWQAPAPEAGEEAPKVESDLEHALTAGFDPTLDLEATAAGSGTGSSSGGAAGGGHSFVMLDATGLQLDPSIGFPTEGLSFASDTSDVRLGALDNGNSVGTAISNTGATADTDTGTGGNNGGNNGNGSGGGTGQTNSAPSALMDTFTLGEGGSAAIDVLGNDTDFDGDTLTVSQVDGQTIAEGGTVIVSNGSVTLTGGQLVFIPDANYTGPASFTYTVTDGLLSSSAAVSGSVTPINDVPIAVGDLLTATEDTPITYAAADLLGNDSDVDGDTLTIASVTNGSGGTAVLNPDGSVTFTPNANFNGVADFTYTVTDGALTSNTATVTVNVAPVNDAPVAVNDSLIATEDTPITYAAADLLGNDSDVDGDSLTIASVTNGSGGTAVLNPDGSVTFTPNANFNGVADFTYTVTDGALTSNTATVTVNVAPVNDIPIAVADTFTLNEDETLTVTSATGVLANDSDAENDTLSASLVSGPAQGSLTLNADGSFSYTPSPNWSGSDSFIYRTFDGTNFSSPVTVILNVVPVADTPDLQLDGSRVLASTDFESAALNGASWSAGVNAADLNNGTGSTWQTDNPSGQVEVGQQSVYMGGSSTNQVIELERIAGDASNLFTNVTAKAGDNYSLDFDYSPRNGALATSNIEVYWDGNLLGTLSSGAVGFTSYHFDLPIPADGTYKLEFRAVDNNSIGGLLDNIELSDVRNIGNEDAWIRLSDISASLTDTDGSETLQITIDSLPAGSFLKDNNGNLFEATGSNVADITGWDKSTLSLLPPPNYNGSLTLNVTATATETANNDQSATSAALNVTVNPLNDEPVASNDVVTPASIRSGLHADFYNYREGAVASGFDGPNMASISQAEAFIASSQPNAIFVASSLSFTPTLTHLGSGTELETFLGSASSSLVDINRLSTIDAVVHMRGQINLAAGTYDFRINADDGYIIRINGAVVASLDGTNTDDTTTHSSFTIAAGGLQDIEIAYYDQGGFSRFNAELRSNGAGPYEPVTDSMLSHSPALYGGVETYSISAAELLANDSDPDTGDALSITAVSGATGGTVSLSADFSTITFVREAGFTGTPSFTYTVTDTAGATSNAQVQINPTSTLISGTGSADILIGDSDDNLIMGLAGNDTLTGAGGSDTFVWLKGHTGSDTISDFDISMDLAQRDRIDLRDLLQGENEGNIDNYLQVVSTPLETSLQISTNGQFNVGGSADVTITLENGGAPVDLSSFGATSSQIVTSLIAGADPLVKVDHS